jgi:hypothetical protein
LWLEDSELVPAIGRLVAAGDDRLAGLDHRLEHRAGHVLREGGGDFVDLLFDLRSVFLACLFERVVRAARGAW